MSRRSLWRAGPRLLLVGLTLAIIIPAAARAQTPTPASARVAIKEAFPTLDGSKLVATLVEVTYEPGGASTPHRHPCPVIGYVIEGSVRMQVKGQPEQVYTVGQTFYESPDDVHAVSANASATVPARFLAYFVCDHETKLSLPVPDHAGH